MSSSTLYTIGTALNRAKDNGVSVSILVGGEWITGDVHAVDEFGVVLASDSAQHLVIRIEGIVAVRIAARAPFQPSLPAAAMPMARSTTWS